MKKTDLIFGIYPIIEALSSEVHLDKIYIQKDTSSSKLDQIIDDASKKGLQINYVPSQKLDQLTKSNHQGVAAIISPITLTPLEEIVEKTLNNKSAALFIILDQISDVRNFGAIVRTAECTGVDAIIIPKTGSAPITGDAVKTSAGAIFNIPICKVDHIKDAIYYLKASGIKTVGATEKSSKNIYDIKLDESLAIIMGSEGKGITKSVLPLLDQQAALPLLGEINSLNVSVACGAFLYEIVRQRNLA